MARTLPTRRFPEPVTIQVGPWVGMNDASDPTAAKADRVALAQNVYVAPGPEGTAFVGRPGFSLMGDTLTRLGTGSNRTVQWLGEFVEPDGTRHCIAIVGGQFYTYNFALGEWTETLDAGDFSGASITVSVANRIYAVPFFGQLLVSDGTNVPWLWDGTAGAGLTKCTNCPVLYGAPRVYYGKVFGIKATDRATLVWSEEGDANLGYDTSPYSNAWTLVATGSDPLTAIGARNEALAVFRERQTQRVLGAVSTDFQSAGTQADAAIDVGTTVPETFEVGQGTLFVDADAGPYLLPPAGPPVALWPWSQQTTRTVPRSELDRVQFAAHPELNLVLVAMPEPNQTECTIALCYDADTLTLVGLWRGFTMQRVGVVRDASGTPRLMHGETDGRIYLHGTAEAGPWDDQFDAGAVPVQHEVVCPPLGYDLETETRWTDIEVGLVGANMTSVTLDYDTPRGGPEVAVVLDVTPSTVILYDTGVQYDDGAQYATVTLDRRGRGGANALGRYIKPKVRHAALGEQFGITAVRVRGYEAGSHFEGA